MAAPFPTTATPSDLVGRVLGLNPGMMTGPGTNTYLVGRRDPILIDTGAGVPDYVPLLERYLAERGFTQPSRVLLTHRHRDHLGGVASLRARFKGLRVSKMRHKDAELPEPIEDLRAGETVHGEGATLVPVYTPGHASHHVVYFDRSDGTAYVGDVAGVRIPPSSWKTCLKPSRSKYGPAFSQRIPPVQNITTGCSLRSRTATSGSRCATGPTSSPDSL